MTAHSLDNFGRFLKTFLPGLSLAPARYETACAH